MKTHKYHGVILDRDSFDRGDIDATELESGPVRWRSYGYTLPPERNARIADAAVVITNKVVIDRELIVANPTLKLVLAAATGTDNIDIACCRERGITVCNARNYSTPAVAQHTIGLMLNLLTNQHRYMQDVRAGAWSESNIFCLLTHPISETADRTLGLIGFGTIGRKVAEIATALGMQVIVCQRPGGAPQRDRVPLEQLLAEADVVSLHCPLNEATHHLIGTRELALMKRDAVIINTARGAIIDIEALAQALQQGVIAGAGIDVFAGEPPDMANPLLESALPNLIITPHNAWATRESRQRLVDILSTNLRAWEQGTPLNTVT